MVGLGAMPIEVTYPEMAYLNYFNWFYGLSVNLFKWEFPEDIEENMRPLFLEKTLFNHGSCLFFNHPSYGYMTLPQSGSGNVNAYGEQTRFDVKVANEVYTVPATDAVLIPNNVLYRPSYFDVHMFCSRLAKANDVQDQNLTALRMPFIFGVPEGQIMTAKNVFKQVKEGKDAIIGYKEMLNPEIFKILDTHANYYLDKLDAYRKNIINECLTFIGIKNANTDKKERMITDEANANNEFVSNSAEMRLKARELACEEIERKFGIKVSVTIDHDEDNYENDDTTSPDQESEGGEEDGSLHDRD